MPRPACDVEHHQEPIATNTVYSDTPTIDSGVWIAQIFVGAALGALDIDIHGMKMESEFVDALQDVMRTRGEPMKLISNLAQTKIREHVYNTLQCLFTDNWQHEVHHQHQNPCKQVHADIKQMSNHILDCTGSPPSLWLLALK